MDKLKKHQDRVRELEDFERLYESYQDGGKLPKDYDKFLEFSKTAPENRRPEKGWSYGDPTKYDHYGMWDALGRPNTWDDGLKANPDYKPDPSDSLYHGFSANPNTGTFLKSYTPGKQDTGNTIYKEVYGFERGEYGDFNPKTTQLYLNEDKRLQYRPRKATGGPLEEDPIKRDATNIARNKEGIKFDLDKQNQDVHSYQMAHNPEYAAKWNKIGKETTTRYGGIDYAKEDIRSKSYTGSPNSVFSGDQTGELAAGTENFNNELISSLLPLPGIAGLKLPAKTPQALVDNASRIDNSLNTIAHGIKNLPKRLSKEYQAKALKALEEGNAWNEAWFTDPATKFRTTKKTRIDRMIAGEEARIEETASRARLTKGGVPKDQIDAFIEGNKVLYDRSYNSGEGFTGQGMFENGLLRNIKNPDSYKVRFESDNNKWDRLLSGRKRLHNGNNGISGYGLDRAVPANMRVNIVDKNIANAGAMKSTIVHEGTHGLTEGDLYLYNRLDEIRAATYQPEDYILNGHTQQTVDAVAYLSDPTEVHARIMELRRQFKIKPGDYVGYKDIENIMAKGKDGATHVDKAFFTLIKDKRKFKDLFNNLPAVAGAAMIAPQLESKATGGLLDGVKPKDRKRIQELMNFEELYEKYNK